MNNPIANVFSALGYTLSLPERLVRSLAAAVGGTTKLLTDTLIPEPLRKTNAYTAIVGNAQRFVIEQVADVQGVYTKEQAEALPDNYVPRKIAGNVVDAAGMFSLHLSPLWVFAIATDVAQGSKVYLNRLVDELKQNKVLGPDVEIRKIDDLLESLGQAGQKTAQVFDAPPVDVAQIKQLRDQLTTGYQRVFANTTNLMPRIDEIWAGMEKLAKRDNVAVESIVGLMAIDLNQVAGKAMNAAFSVGSVTTDFLSEKVFKSYGETLERVSQRGAVVCLEEAAAPFVGAILSHLSAEKQTWTEWALNKLVSPFTSSTAVLPDDSVIQLPDAPPKENHSPSHDAP